MPRAEIATKQAKYTLEQLHAELGGKIIDNKKAAKRLAQAMLHVEAVLKMIEPGYNVRSIAVRRRKPNPWFKRGTVFRSAICEAVTLEDGEPISDVIAQVGRAWPLWRVLRGG